MSHALRVRGLKRVLSYRLPATEPVARSTRAWIETDQTLSSIGAGASHALRVRGLKPINAILMVDGNRVARSTRAWIETK